VLGAAVARRAVLPKSDRYLARANPNPAQHPWHASIRPLLFSLRPYLLTARAHVPGTCVSVSEPLRDELVQIWRAFWVVGALGRKSCGRWVWFSALGRCGRGRGEDWRAAVGGAQRSVGAARRSAQPRTTALLIASAAGDPFLRPMRGDFTLVPPSSTRLPRAGGSPVDLTPHRPRQGGSYLKPYRQPLIPAAPQTLVHRIRPP